MLFPWVLMFIEAWLTLHRTWDHRALCALSAGWRMHAFSCQQHVHWTQRGQSQLVLGAKARSLDLAHVASGSLIAWPRPGASLSLKSLDLMDCDYCPELHFWGVVTHSFVRFQDPLGKKGHCIPLEHNPDMLRVWAVVSSNMKLLSEHAQGGKER